MNEGEREDLLVRWSRPSSDDEVEQQERAMRMVTDAIAASGLAGVPKRIYAKGSYANNTNVRKDSDVDISVDCHDCMYYESHETVSPKVSLPVYTGSWTPSAWRQAIVDALKQAFGTEVDTSGSIAIHLRKVEGSRPNMDVVPGFNFRKYFSADQTSSHDGSKVFPTSGEAIINWPDQQLQNGRDKNDATHKRYKGFVRALKNVENRLVELRTIQGKPSYLMECLMFNAGNPTLHGGTWSADFRATLQELWHGLSDEAAWKTWLEPNRLKWAFVGNKNWSVTDAKDVVKGAWNLLEYS